MIKKTALAMLLALLPALSQVEMKPGDIITFNVYANYSLLHVDRETGTVTPISGRRYDPNWVLLFQNTEEIQQHNDGNFYVGNLPYNHILQVNPRYSRSESKNLRALDPKLPITFNYQLKQSSHVVTADGICYRIGSNFSGDGAVVAHKLSDGESWIVSENNYLTSDIAVIASTSDGNLIVIQNGTSKTIVIVDPQTGDQTPVESNLTLGRVTDLEVLKNGSLAIAAAHSGLLIVDYRPADPPLTGYVAEVDSYDPPGGFVYRVKEDIDGNPIVAAQTNACCNNYTGSKLDLETGEFSEVYSDLGVAFEIVKHPITLEERIDIFPGANGSIVVEFYGTLMSSNDLGSWAKMEPQPMSPYNFYPPAETHSTFFKLQSNGDISIPDDTPTGPSVILPPSVGPAPPSFFIPPTTVPPSP